MVSDNNTKNTTIENINETEELENQKKIAIAYARYLRENNLKPGDATFIEPEDLDVELIEEKPVEPVEIDEQDFAEAVEKAEQISAEAVDKAAQISAEEPAETVKADDAVTVAVETEPAQATPEKSERIYEKVVAVDPEEAGSIVKALASVSGFFDDAAHAINKRVSRKAFDLRKYLHDTFTGYSSAKKTIWTSILSVFVMCAVLMMVLDSYTVYEYAYNGKVLGYVDAQEDVTNVLDVAGDQLNEVNEETGAEIEFSTKDNISFKKVDGTSKDVDDVDTTVNKLAYLTDIEVEAYGIYDGSRLVTIVKSQDAAEKLLDRTMEVLGAPDKGMELVSVEFEKPLDIKPINVLLTSVQSDKEALKQMTEGGDVQFYHLVEDGETLGSIEDTFGVEKDSIYDEDNKNAISRIDTGDKICIRKTVTPVSVKMVETGKMKEIVPYKTIKKKSKDYYIGDEIVGVEGVNGVQIFEGTLTKIGGEIADRDTVSLEVITKKVDKVVYVGTTKRPKTAPTGIFKNPMTKGTYVVTSAFKWRWGRQHSGIDMGAPTGTPVYAADGGTVTGAGYFGGYGNCIDMDNGIASDGSKRTTRYGHLSYIAVKTGQKVYQGQYIGEVGSTGHSTGPHLHFEIRYNGNATDPIPLISDGVY
ncbi:MAG: peptidoglycan DD-metalloendopeptidase family protein [Clostridiales bacterium]|nr:peptidoglycan DD-metalloendopeptidase family protein [Candidatus Crickella caballi]